MEKYTLKDLLNENAKAVLESELNKPDYIRQMEDFCIKNEWNCKIVDKNGIVRLYIATPMSVWKIIPENDEFILCHHNYMKGINAINDRRIETGINYYHFQNDVKKPFCNISGLLEYIKRHDKSREQEKRGIETMPNRTRKQRKWKRDAEYRKKKHQIQNVYKLLDNL